MPFLQQFSSSQGRLSDHLSVPNPVLLPPLFPVSLSLVLHYPFCSCLSHSNVSVFWGKYAGFLFFFLVCILCYVCVAWHIGWVKCLLNEYLISRVLYGPSTHPPFGKACSVLFVTGLGMCRANRNILLCPFSFISQNSQELHPWHQHRQLILRSGASAGRQPFPSSPAQSSFSTNPFSFLGVQSSESRGLSGREAAVGCLLGGRKGVWGSQDMGGSAASGGTF